MEACGLGEAMPQMSRQLELPFDGRGEAPKVERSVEALTAPPVSEGSGATRDLNLSNRRMRTRMSGGVGGVIGQTTGAPIPLVAHYALRSR